MRIDALELEGFRNWDALSVELHPRYDVVVGDNAQGKTNLLEALGYLAGGRSFRTRSDRELIGHQRDEARIAARLWSGDRERRARILLSRTRRRRIDLDGVPGTGTDLSEALRAVVFRPEDLSLVRAGAAERRRFLDAALCQLRPRYAAALSGYRRALEQKSRILRSQRERPDLLAALPAFETQMIRYGAAVVSYRSRYAPRLAAAAAERHRECSGGRERLSIRYVSVSTLSPDELAAGIREDRAAEALTEHLASHGAAERASGQCLSGPHRDDLLVEIDGREARKWASQGQARTAALSMGLAEREILRDASGGWPVLLLDDVLGELDPRRQRFVLERIDGGQVFITCCEEDRLPTLPEGRVLRVREGHLEA